LLFAKPVSDWDNLRRREADYVAGEMSYGSGSANEYLTRSVNLPTRSVADYPTNSLQYLTQSATGPYISSATAALSAYFSFNTVAAPAITSATPTEPMFNVVSPSVEPNQPQLFTGTGFRHSTITASSVFVALLGLCWMLY
jgi:hypothetical protein